MTLTNETPVKVEKAAGVTAGTLGVLGNVSQWLNLLLLRVVRRTANGGDLGGPATAEGLYTTRSGPQKKSQCVANCVDLGRQCYRNSLTGGGSLLPGVARNNPRARTSPGRQSVDSN